MQPDGRDAVRYASVLEKKETTNDKGETAAEGHSLVIYGRGFELFVLCLSPFKTFPTPTVSLVFFLFFFCD